MPERLEAHVSGRVQMVMFRDFTQRKATNLRLQGEVKNLADGRVHVIAEGPRDSLEALLEKLFVGPALSNVEAIEVTWATGTNEFKKFTLITGKW